MAPGRSETSIVDVLLAADTSGANGDDAAMVNVPGGLACVSTDTAVVGVHLHESLTPHERGWRAAGCALSDLAAMGAIPLALTCSVSAHGEEWEAADALVAGVRDRATSQGAQLVGGDLAATPGPTSVTVTVIGTAAGVGRGGFIRRSGARPGDELWVTGQLGRSAASLTAIQAASSSAPRSWYCDPPDRIAAGRALARHANAMIDLSDGLASDARHLATASGCGFVIDLDAVPCDDAASHLPTEIPAQIVAATAGDDYELLVALAPAAVAAARSDLGRACPGLALTKIGVCADSGCTFLLGGIDAGELRGYTHA
jgi:thiamine-monophosphate kinase